MAVPYMALAAIVLNTVTFTGITSGIQGMFDPLLERGVFSDLCHGPNVTLPCAAQKRAMAQSADAMLSVLNLCAVVVGAIVDVAGAQRSAVAFIAMGTVGIACCGFAPSNGGVFVTCIIVTAISNSGGFLTMVTRYLPGLLTDPQQVQLWSGLLTGFWDMSGAVGNAIGQIVSIRALPLYCTMLICGLGLGLPLLLVFSTYMPRALVQAAAAADGDASVNLTPSAPPSLLDIVRSGVGAARFAFRQPIYYITVCNGIAVVLFGYLFIANVGAFVQWKGATADEERHMRAIFNIMLACGGFFPLVVSPITSRLSIRRARFAALGHQALLLGVAVASALALPLSWQYVTFAAIIVWRILYFAVINGAILSELASCGAAMGMLFGLSYTIAGGISLAVGPAISSALARDGDGTWPVVFGVWAGFATSSILALAVCPRVSAQPGTPPDEAHDETTRLVA